MFKHEQDDIWGLTAIMSFFSLHLPVH